MNITDTKEQLLQAIADVHENQCLAAGDDERFDIAHDEVMHDCKAMNENMLAKMLDEMKAGSTYEDYFPSFNPLTGLFADEEHL